MALATLAVAPRAHAQPNVVIAEKLFREGQDLFEASKSDDSKTHLACEKFAESQKLRPALGTLLNLAVCHEKEKKTASAWAEYTEVAGQATRAGQADRAQFASQHAAGLEHQLCRLRLEMSAPPPGTEVKIDGQSLGSSVWGTDIPLDPGSHTVVVSAPSKQSWSRTITLGPDQTMDREEVPALLNEGATGAVPAGPAGATPATSHPDTTEAPSQGKGPVPYIVGGAGVAVAIVGVVLIAHGAGLSSDGSSDLADASAKSGGNQKNLAALTSYANSESSAGTASTVIGAVAGGVGLVGVGIGIYMLVSGTSKPAPPKTGTLHFTPDVGPGHAGGAVSFSF